MTAVSDEVLQYPFVEDDALDVDPAFKELQRRAPVRVQMEFGEPAWLVTRYDDARKVFSDKRFSRVKLHDEAPAAFRGPSLIDASMPLAMDPPDHFRVRRLTAPQFTPKVIRAMGDQIQQVVELLLDGMVDQGPGADFTASFAWDLPINALTMLLGVPLEDADRFREWVETSSSELVPEAERVEAMMNTAAYNEELIAARRASPHEDLLGVLVAACDSGESITEPELRGLIMSLIVGGFETTATQLGSTVYALMTHPAQWQELVDGRADMDAALNELWRWIPAFRYGTTFPRWALEDVELSDGFVVRAGDAVMPEQPVANRDEAVFPNGWELDFHRDDPRPHLALGFGQHLCMGIHLAKLQVELTVRTLVDRFPTLALAVPADQIEWPKWFFMRTVGAMPLTW
jgi:cytochrome P450